MNILSWMLSLGILVWLMTEAVSLHRANVCRQEAWLKSTELRTRALLHDPKDREKDWHLGCRLILFRDGTTITWRRLPSLTEHNFELDLGDSL